MPSSTSVYAGQAFTVSYLLYYRVPLIDPDDEINLQFRDCFVVEFAAARPPEREETIGGQVYKVQLLKKYLLIPQLTGALPLPVLKRRYRFTAPAKPEDFFGGEQMVTKTIRSSALQVAVKALPATGDSTAFSRAVGKFRVRVTYSQPRKDDHFLTVKVRIKGLGNLRNVRLRPPPMPDNVDVFNVRGKEEHALTADGLEAEYVYTYDVLAAYQGTYELPGPRLSYFEPEAGQYVAFTAPPYRWRVTHGGQAPTRPAGPAPRPAGRHEGLYTKADFYQDRVEYLFFGSPACDAVLVVSGLLFLGGIALGRYWALRAANSQYYRYRNAKKRALQALKKLDKASAPDVDSYYKTLRDVLVSYLCSKLDRPEAAFSARDLAFAMQPFQVPLPLWSRTAALLEVLAKSRFSATRPATIPTHYRTELLALIHELDACFPDKVHPPVLVGAAV
ncbi:hypothetical protein [Hymenobacter rubidus]|uniref:hypothetical protein n=1 Tax=Hymenobacter rubidus TaxID=1441626 RepID=UPI001F3250C1|nr:hypothetical protein [Hymenobacter rubidus]